MRQSKNSGVFLNDPPSPRNNVVKMYLHYIAIADTTYGCQLEQHCVGGEGGNIIICNNRMKLDDFLLFYGVSHVFMHVIVGFWGSLGTIRCDKNIVYQQL